VSLQRQIAFWIAALVGFILFLYVFSGILLPFVAGMILAYLLDPVADRLERLGMGRLAAVFVILAAFVVGFVLVLILVMPILGHQLAGFLTRLPDYVTRLQQFIAAKVGDGDSPTIIGMTARDLQSSLGGLVSQGAQWLAGVLASLWSGGQALLSILALLVVTPVVAFYMLLDWDRMTAAVDAWIPRDSVDTVRELFREMDEGVSGFIRGQVSVCLILGLYYAIGLSLVGLNFGLLIGIVIGLISFIPYVGATVGLVVSVGVAVAQFWPEWTPIALVLGVFAVGQFLEGNVLQPKLIGGHIGLHPVWLMFALFAFGYLLGFVGLLIGVPAAAAVGVLARFAIRRYLASPFYTGQAGGAARGPSP
jgi:predicted PurR-regulated permease PerM